MNNDTDSDSLSATNRRRETDPTFRTFATDELCILALTPHPIPRPGGRRIKIMRVWVSKIMVHRDPSSGMTTMILLVGSRNTTANRNQLSIGQAAKHRAGRVRSGRDCVRKRLQDESVFVQLNIWVSASRNYAETKTRVTAVTETRPKPICELRP